MFWVASGSHQKHSAWGDINKGDTRRFPESRPCTTQTEHCWKSDTEASLPPPPPHSRWPGGRQVWSKTGTRAKSFKGASWAKLPRRGQRLLWCTLHHKKSHRKSNRLRGHFQRGPSSGKQTGGERLGVRPTT